MLSLTAVCYQGCPCIMLSFQVFVARHIFGSICWVQSGSACRWDAFAYHWAKSHAMWRSTRHLLQACRSGLTPPPSPKSPNSQMALCTNCRPCMTQFAIYESSGSVELLKLKRFAVIHLELSQVLVIQLSENMRAVDVFGRLLGCRRLGQLGSDI